MKKSIYAYTDYKAFLLDLMESHPNGGRGQRKALADAINCQVAYVTHVFSGANHFSLEQTEAAARHFSLSKEETEFLLLILQQNRAGTVELRQFFDRLIKEHREKHNLLKDRLKIKDTLTREDQAMYYSSWQYAAIHIALTVPKLRTVERLSERFQIPTARVLEILNFLCTKGLATKTLNSYQTTQPFLHLENDSPLIAKHHGNWRIRTVQNLDNNIKENLHYSLAFSVARDDLPKIRERLMRALEDCADIIKPSKEEEVACLCLDLFQI